MFNVTIETAYRRQFKFQKAFTDSKIICTNFKWTQGLKVLQTKSRK